MRRTHPTLFLALIAALVSHPEQAEAQFRRGGEAPQDRTSGWAPAYAGVRGGYDYNSNASVLGAQLRLPVLPGGHVEIVPNAEVTFLTGLKEYQGSVDAVYVTGGRMGGLYAGAGIAWRNTLWNGPERETRRAPTVVAGLRSGTLFGAPFGTQLEMRWTYPEGVFKPRALTLGLNFPLWGRTG